jgi:hypothetical protein
VNKAKKEKLDLIIQELDEITTKVHNNNVIMEEVLNSNFFKFWGDLFFVKRFAKASADTDKLIGEAKKLSEMADEIIKEEKIAIEREKKWLKISS